jgi:hypothetical protein
MNTIINLLRNLWKLLACIGELLGYLLRFVSAFFQTRTSLAARLLAAESQLGICKRRVEQKGSPRFRFTAGFRLLWVVLSKFWAPWQAAVWSEYSVAPQVIEQQARWGAMKEVLRPARKPRETVECRS